MGSDITLEWSTEAVVTDADGGAWSPFVMGTYAVRAEWPDGTWRIRVLRPGLALTRKDLPDDEIFAARLRGRFITQDQPVVIEA